jgi:hypothetical protein
MTVQVGSRYEDAERNSVVQHFYDEWGHPLLEDQDGHVRFYRTSTQSLYILNTLPAPLPPPAEYYAKQDENMPFIAFKFMDDSLRWWEIAEVNPQIWYPLDLLPGSYIRIPS